MGQSIHYKNDILIRKVIENLDDSDEERKVKDKVHRRRGHGGQME